MYSRRRVSAVGAGRPFSLISGKEFWGQEAKLVTSFVASDGRGCYGILSSEEAYRSMMHRPSIGLDEKRAAVHPLSAILVRTAQHRSVRYRGNHRCRRARTPDRSRDLRIALNEPASLPPSRLHQHSCVVEPERTIDRRCPPKRRRRRLDQLLACSLLLPAADREYPTTWRILA